MTAAVGPRRGRPWLAPLGGLFGAAAALRAGLHRHGWLSQARLLGPVVSVGNLSVGGTGKTPVVALIAGMLRDAGHPVAILSRGYGGVFRGAALVVADGERILAGAAEAGDEPVMLAQMLPRVVVAVGARRDVVGRAVEARFGRRIHVLDDGFQHLRLARNLDVLVAEAADFADRPLPAGRLREFPSAALRADVVLLDEGAWPEPWSMLDAGRVFRRARRVLGFFDAEGRPCRPPRRAWLVSGIARPERFQRDAAAEGGEIVGTTAFHDHHRFRPDEIEDVARRARSAHAEAIVTTAKDFVRWPVVQLDLPVLVLRIAVVVAEEARFRERLLAAVGTAA